MFFIHFLFALLMALILCAVFVLGFGKKGPWDRFSVFFIIVLLAAWAGGVWLNPVGPPFLGVHWVSFLLVGLLIALLLAAAIPPKDSQSTVEIVEPGEQLKEQKALARTLGAFLWVFLLVLVLSIVVRYL